MKKTNRAILAALAVMVFSFSACAEEGEEALLIQEDVLVEQYEAEVEEITIDLPIDELEGAVVEPQADEEACYYEDSEEETDSVPMDDSAALENEAVNAVDSESIIVLEETAEQMPEASEAGVEKVLIEEEITDIEASTTADSEALVTEWEQAENADDTKDANDDGTASSKSGKMKSSKSKTSVDTDDSSAETSGNADESDEAVETTAIDTTASKSSKSSKSHSAKSSKATKTGFNAKSSSSAGSRSSQGKASTETGDADSQDDTSTLGIQLDGGESDYITVLSENTLRLTPSGDGMEWSVPSSAIETLQGDGITTLELVLDGEITTLEIAEAAQAVDSSEAEATAEKGKTVKQSAKKTEALTWIISDAGIVCEYGSLQLSWGAVSSIDYEAV